jgi:hypothetical protein
MESGGWRADVNKIQNESTLVPHLNCTWKERMAKKFHLASCQGIEYYYHTLRTNCYQKEDYNK